MNIFNRFFMSILLLLGTISSFSYATGTSNNIITDDKTNESILNTLGATDIVDLSAHFTNSTYIISNFIIKSLPSENLGTLYMANGTTPVTLCQQLTQAEADGLKFDPVASCTATDVVFTYVGVSDAGVKGTVAKVTIPLSISAGCSVFADDKNNQEISNTSGAVNILGLSGKDSNGNAVNSFIITSLPSSNQGVLYMADGTTPVQVNQILNFTEANALKFDPNSNFVGDASFTYLALDDNGVKSIDEATVIIPLINPTGSNAPTADDKNNQEILNTLGAVNILDLSGKDSDGNAVNRFIITSLPSSNQGILYMLDGTTPIQINQTLSLAEANGLKFDPNSNFVGDVTFTYVALDANDIKSINDATVTIPLVNPVGSNTPTADNKYNPEMLNTLSAVNISNLSGKDSDGNSVNRFIITSLPSSNQGILYMADGTTPVQINQTLSLTEANGLKFDPNSNFVGDVIFTYVALDDNDIKSIDDARVTIPLINPVGSNVPTADDKNNPEMLNTLGAVNILDLSGTDSDGNTINSFIITSLPSVNQGILYMSDGTTPVRINQTLTLTEANGLKFDPNSDFVGDVTFRYIALDDNGIQSSNATVTIPLVNPTSTNAPTAEDKVNPKMLNTLGAVNILDLSGKDSNGDAITSFIITSLPSPKQGVLYMADGKTVVRLNQTLTLEEANGLKFDPNIDFIGDVKFTYMAVDANGIKSSNARVTIPVVASYNTDIVIHNDVGVANGNSDPIVIDVLGNDTGTLAGARVRLVNSDGTFTDEIKVEGEGVWSVNSDNMIVFTPVTPFVGTPSPINYVVRDANGAVSNTATVTIKGQCVCKPYTEDIPVFSSLGLFLMMFLSMILGLGFIKKETI